MGRFVDLTDKKFQAWTVLSRAPKTAYGRTAWNCRCSCGGEFIVAGCHLISGASSKCKTCYSKKLLGPGSMNFKHGHRGRTYRIWCNMIQRCENPNNNQFPNYGARGIAVCESWRSDYRNFWADMGECPSPSHQIDRKNNNLGYEPSNCRWATQSENMLNTRRNHLVIYHGETMPLTEACRRAGVNHSTARWRIKHGRPFTGATQ
jgi:hypothetical protein